MVITHALHTLSINLWVSFDSKGSLKGTMASLALLKKQNIVMSAVQVCKTLSTKITTYKSDLLV